MFATHFAVGLAAKRAVPAVSLGWLFLAVQFADLLWPTLVLVGVEHVEVAPGASAAVPLAFTHYPYSHSLAALVAWSALFAVAARTTRCTWPTALLLGGMVVSHWFLDMLVHVPDLPLYPAGDAVFGLGLWRWGGAVLVVELAALAAGAWLYARATRPADRWGTWLLVGLVAFLAVVQIANLLGPPPPDATAVAWAGQAQWLLVAWGYWVDRNRVTPAVGRTEGVRIQ